MKATNITKAEKEQIRLYWNGNLADYKSGWYQALKTAFDNDNVKKLIKVEEKGFLTSIGFLYLKSGELIIIHHKINDVNTAYLLTEFDGVSVFIDDIK